MPTSLSNFPDEAKSPEEQDVEALLAQELNQMSFKEREKMYEEIHGVESSVDETPEFVKKHLQALATEIELIPVKPAYDEALRRFPDYIKSKKFRIMFLRTELFDSKRAANRLVNFLENKRTLFGIETLGRPLQYRDLDEDARKSFQTGVYQWLPARDRTGRPVFTNLHLIFREKCYKNSVDMVKAYFYLTMALIEEDEEAQKKGVICLFYFMGGHAMEFDWELHSRMPRTMDWLPFRFVSVHICSGNVLNTFLRSLMSTMTKQLRVRLRFHGGTHTECQYGLLTFGVPTHTLPVNYEGELKNQTHDKWIAKLKIRDETRRRGEPFDGIDLPGTNDVLLGRGRTFQDHSGSIKLRYMVDEYMEDYCDASKIGKTKVTWNVVKAVQASGGRFLKRRDDGWWAKVSDDAARTKVGMSFRTALSTKSRTKVEAQKPRFVELENRKRFRIGSESKSCFGFCNS